MCLAALNGHSNGNSCKEMQREVRSASAGYVCRPVAAGWRDLGQYNQGTAIETRGLWVTQATRGMAY